MVSEIPLSEFGLLTVEGAAAARGWGVRALQNWINGGLIPAARAGTGRRCVFLLRKADVDAFTAPPRGRPARDTGAVKPIPAGTATPNGKGKGRK